MSFQHYKLELTIDLIETLPITMSIAKKTPDTEKELADIINNLDTAIHWLNIEKENELRFFKYRQEQKK